MEPSGAETQSTANKVFTFKDEERSGAECLSVVIPEVLDAHYGMHVWPCAAVLAQYLWTRREALRGRTVLELGAGVSLPGVLAARCGAQVTLSDGKNPLCLENCRRSCEANGLTVTGPTTTGLTVTGPPLSVGLLALTWGEVSPELLLLPQLDLILGSDVFYEPQDFEDVLLTVAFLLRKNPLAQFWTSYQERSADWSIEAALRRWGLSCQLVPLEAFGADGAALAGSSLPGNHSVLLMVIGTGP
ncbi:methyltransferase-like protein 23 [Pseudoliparis swirei]|uniref:methyltransferase-like protein 23 n=1 Tax=Pseudoliparis swirei TaxID=2059687 RepID=UPI0024BEF7C0|nr:methyltransferase-like protein 23 [Pseudoliparis swirei]